MNEAVVYLTKMAACSAALYAYYLLALRNRIFHQCNRFYLLAAVLASFIFPLIPMPHFFGAAAQQQTDWSGLFVSTGAEISIEQNTSSSWGIAQWLAALYAIVGAVLLCRFLWLGANSAAAAPVAGAADWQRFFYKYASSRGAFLNF